MFLAMNAIETYC